MHNYLKDDRRGIPLYIDLKQGVSLIKGGKKTLFTQCTPKKAKNSSSTAFQRFSFLSPQRMYAFSECILECCFNCDSLIFKSRKNNSNPLNIYAQAHTGTHACTYTYCHYLENKGK